MYYTTRTLERIGVSILKNTISDYHSMLGNFIHVIPKVDIISLSEDLFEFFYDLPFVFVYSTHRVYVRGFVVTYSDMWFFLRVLRFRPPSVTPSHQYPSRREASI